MELAQNSLCVRLSQNLTAALSVERFYYTITYKDAQIKERPGSIPKPQCAHDYRTVKIAISAGTDALAD